MFSKRHYEAIARVLQDCHPKEYGLAHSHAAEQWAFTLKTMADMFAHDNGAFDHDRFKRACVPGANVRARTARQCHLNCSRP